MLTTQTLPAIREERHRLKLAKGFALDVPGLSVSACLAFLQILAWLPVPQLLCLQHADLMLHTRLLFL
jgi:hypothetical protein